MESVHGILVANTVKAESFQQDAQKIEVLNRSGSAEIYFRLDGIDPTVGGSGTYVLPALAGAAVEADARGISAPTVKLISTGTPDYSITADG